MLVLGIETSCDETAASVVKDGHEILSNIIASQAEIHEKYGGVFPEMACRSHIDMIIPVVNSALKKANVNQEDIDLISVANGPGLIGALLIGLNTAKGLALSWKKPFIGINHIEAHLYAAMMNHINKLIFPALGIVLSGGHTVFLEIQEIGKYKPIGSTIDDAIGEAFDKVASILDMPYPGGPNIEKLAQSGNPKKFNIKAAKAPNKYDFSFSGLKTKILYTVKGQQANRSSPSLLPQDDKKHIAAAFQKAAFDDVVEKAAKASQEYGSKAIYLGGGVTNNQKLREMFQQKQLPIPVFWPEAGLSLDNAAMIAGLGYQKFFKNKLSDPWDLKAHPRIAIS